MAHNYHEMNVSDVIPYLNIFTKTTFPSSCFEPEQNKNTVCAKDRVKAHFKVPQIPTDLLTL